MKYKDLPTQDTVIKLSSYAFARDNVDASVFKFYSASKQIYDFVNNQKVKILEKVATKDESGLYQLASRESSDRFRVEMLDLLQKEIEFDMPMLDISEDDFNPENCCRPNEKELWLNAIEKGAIIRLSELSSEVIDR